LEGARPESLDDLDHDEAVVSFRRRTDLSRDRPFAGIDG
jgi:hypothetical protein